MQMWEKSKAAHRSWVRLLNVASSSCPPCLLIKGFSEYAPLRDGQCVFYFGPHFSHFTPPAAALLNLILPCK